LIFQTKASNHHLLLKEDEEHFQANDRKLPIFQIRSVQTQMLVAQQESIDAIPLFLSSIYGHER
jgi:hypothetical protein